MMSHYLDVLNRLIQNTPKQPEVKLMTQDLDFGVASHENGVLYCAKHGKVTQALLLKTDKTQIVYCPQCIVTLIQQSGVTYKVINVPEENDE